MHKYRHLKLEEREGTSIDNLPQAYLTLLEDKLNSTPRKYLGFLTPNEYWEKMQMAPKT